MAHHYHSSNLGLLHLAHWMRIDTQHHQPRNHAYHEHSHCHRHCHCRRSDSAGSSNNSGQGTRRARRWSTDMGNELFTSKTQFSSCWLCRSSTHQTKACDYGLSCRFCDEEVYETREKKNPYVFLYIMFDSISVPVWTCVQFVVYLVFSRVVLLNVPDT